MPSSRKRNKGKERKAKKAAEKEEAAIVELQQIWQGWVRGNMSGSSVSIQCNHGLVEVVPDNSHPVSKFIDTFIIIRYQLTYEMLVLDISL